MDTGLLAFGRRRNVPFDAWAARLNGVLSAIVDRLGADERNEALVADLQSQMEELKSTSVMAPPDHGDHGEGNTDGDAGVSLSEISNDERLAALEARYAADLAAVEAQRAALADEVAALRALLHATSATEQL